MRLVFHWIKKRINFRRLLTIGGFLVAFFLIIISIYNRYDMDVIHADSTGLTPKLLTNGVQTSVSSDATELISASSTISNASIKITMDNATVIIKDLHLIVTTDMPAIIVKANNVKLVLEGDNTIMVPEGSTNKLYSIISVEEGNSLEITSSIDNQGLYNQEPGKLTITSSSKNYGAVIGSSIITDSGVTTAGNAGDVKISGEAEVNIINKGYGAGIGGAASNAIGMNGGNGGNVTVTNGSLAIYSPAGTYNTCIGGGSAVSTDGMPIGMTTAGNGSSVVIDGGSVYLENDGEGNKLGAGCGAISSSTTNGTVLNSMGQEIHLYKAIAPAEGEVSSEISPVLYDLERTSGEQEYQYRITNKTMSCVLYNNTQTRDYIATTVLYEDLLNHYDYAGFGHTSFYTTSGTTQEGGEIDQSDGMDPEINSTLYFYLPASQRVGYAVNIQAGLVGGSVNYTLPDGYETIDDGKVEYGTEVTINPVTDADYEIKSVYYVTASGSRQYVTNSGTGYIFRMPAEAVTIGAVFALPEYDIVYNNTFDALNPNPTKYNVQSEITLQPIEHSGYTFNGWATPTGVKVTSIGPRQTGTITLVALWSETVYTVTFLDDDDSFIDNVTVVEGDAAVPPPDPQRDRMLFNGWDTDFTNVTSDLTVRATYIEDPDAEPIIPDTYDVIIYDSIQYGEVTSSRATDIQKDEAVTIYVTPDRGYRLVGLECIEYIEGVTQPTENLSGVTVNLLGSNFLANDDVYAFNMPDNDVFINAVFEPIEYTIEYLLMGGVNNAANPIKYTVNTPTITLAAPTRSTDDDYEFDSWYDTSNRKVTSIIANSIGNITLAAGWIAPPQIIEVPSEVIVTSIVPSEVIVTSEVIVPSVVIETSIVIETVIVTQYIYITEEPTPGYIPAPTPTQVQGPPEPSLELTTPPEITLAPVEKNPVAETPVQQSYIHTGDVSLTILYALAAISIGVVVMIVLQKKKRSNQ